MGGGTAKLVDGIRGGDRVSLARSITLIENGDPRGEAILAALSSRTGRALRVGLTGPPGAGKSTLVRCLVRLLTEGGHKVGVLAVDPSSPFTGGALLGDRVRMTSVALHPNVFIRSMASRGALGGLAVAAAAAADLLDAFGRDVILIETVGVGQSEVDIADVADTALVVLSPESGDGIQAMKAGLLEIASVVVLNKADRPGADRASIDIEQMLALRQENGWTVPVLLTVAERDEGTDEVLKTVFQHRDHLVAEGTWDRQRRAKIRRRIRLAAEHRFRIAVLGRLARQDWDEAVEEVATGRATVAQAAADLVSHAGAVPGVEEGTP